MKKVQLPTRDEINPAADPDLDDIGRLLLRLADMLRIIVDALVEFGNQLIARAQANDRSENLR
jgi:hypothetical protein